MIDPRVIHLEVLAAEQDRTIEELSQEVARQWQVIDKMQQKLDALTARFLSIEEQSAPDVPITKPPHY